MPTKLASVSKENQNTFQDVSPESCKHSKSCLLRFTPALDSRRVISRFFNYVISWTEAINK